MSELLAHIEALNAETRKWVAEGPGRIAFELHTNIAHWAESGVYTVEDFKALMQAEHEREMRKEAMYYNQYDDADDHYDTHWSDDSDDIYTTNADRNYFDSFDDWCEKQSIEDENEYEIWYAESQMKKYGVDTIIMIPTHYELMANNAGFLEY